MNEMYSKNMLIWSNEIKPALEALESNGTILFPTDTIWGLGCDATSREAIMKINKIKQRPSDKGYVLLAADINMIKEYVEQVEPKIETLLIFHNRPLTVVYENAKNLPNEAYAFDGSVAFRVPLDPFCLDLLKSFGKPIVATSANVNEMPAPKHFGEISSEVILQVEYIFKYKQNDKTENEPSVIAKLNNKNELIAIRK